MNTFNKKRRSIIHVAIAAVMLFVMANRSFAELEPMGEDILSSIHGQGGITVTLKDIQIGDDPEDTNDEVLRLKASVDTDLSDTASGRDFFIYVGRVRSQPISLAFDFDITEHEVTDANNNSYTQTVMALSFGNTEESKTIDFGKEPGLELHRIFGSSDPDAGIPESGNGIMADAIRLSGAGTDVTGQINVWGRGNTP